MTNSTDCLPEWEDDVPDWEELVAARPGDGSGLDGLIMLVKAVLLQKDINADFTKEDLKKRLNLMYPEQAPFSDETIDDLVQRAIEHNILDGGITPRSRR